MLKILFTITLSLATSIVFSQEKTKQVKTIDGSKYPVPSVTPEMLEYAKTNGTFVTKLVDKGDGLVAIDGEVSKETTLLVDPIKMNFKILDREQYYKIVGTDTYLVVKSTWALDGEMKMRK